MDKKTIGIFFGGISLEHEVSVITGLQALERLDRDQFIGVPVYVSKSGQWLTGEFVADIANYKHLAEVEQRGEAVELFHQSGRVGLRFVKKAVFAKQQEIPLDVIFPCFHGGSGENGGFQGLCEFLEVPFVGPGVLASAIGMDKISMKQVFAAADLPISPYAWFYRSDFEHDRKAKLAELEKRLTYPIFVKPASAGSSVGITRVTNTTELEQAIEVAAAYDERILVEQGFMEAREVNVSVLGLAGMDVTTSVCEEVFPSDGLLSYADKYQSNTGKSQGMASTKRVIPADLPDELVNTLAHLAQAAFSAISGGGVARVDFLVRPDTKEVTLVEINTIPGSLSFYLWEKSGLSFTQLLSKLISLAQERQTRAKEHTTSFTSNILENFKPGVKNKA